LPPDFSKGVTAPVLPRVDDLQSWFEMIRIYIHKMDDYYMGGNLIETQKAIMFVKEALDQLTKDQIHAFEEKYPEEADLYEDIVKHVFELLEDIEPEGPTPGDYMMAGSGPLGSKTAVTVFDGKYLGTFDTDTDAEKAIKDAMVREQFYPNVWYVDDHGGLNLRKLHVAGKEEIIMAKNQKERIKELEDKVKALEHKDEYSGWSNRETWALVLWIDNDQGLYNEAREKVKEIIKNIDDDKRVKEKTWKRDEAMVFVTEDTLKEWLEDMRSEAFEDPANFKGVLKMWDDIGSDYRIDWREVAEHYVRGELEEMEYEKRKEKKTKETIERLMIGDKVKLRDDVLQRHARSVPAHLGYTHEQFQWRDTLRELKDKIGTIRQVFEDSKEVNVDFDGRVIGINSSELLLVERRP
jgi:hypothetical protein